MTSKKEIIQIPIDEITPDPGNLRKTFDPEDISALADNMREHGQMDPIQVFEKEQGYDLLDGERRWRAAKLARLSSLAALVVPKPTKTDLLCKKISRFMQTRNLPFPEEIKALEEGLRALGVERSPEKWSGAAKKLGVTPNFLRERMRIANLAPDLRERFNKGDLDYTVSQAVGRIDDQKLQRQVADFVVDEGISNRFAVTRLIPTILENPKKSLMENYDDAKRAEKYRYAAPRKEEIPANVEERIDELLEDFRRCVRWMEAAGRRDLISYLSPNNFNTRRTLVTFRHLYHLLGGFLSAYNQRYASSEKDQKRFASELAKTLQLGPPPKDTGHS